MDEVTISGRDRDLLLSALVTCRSYLWSLAQRDEEAGRASNANAWEQKGNEMGRLWNLVDKNERVVIVKEGA